MTDGKFVFELPEDWEDQTVYVFRGPKLEEVEHKMMLYLDRVLLHDTVDTFAEEKMRPIIENLQGLKILKSEETTIEGGNPTYEFVAKWIPADEVIIFKKYVFVLWGAKGFMFSCDLSKKSYKILGGQMNDIIESLLPGTYKPVEY